jgi:ribonuclease I
LAREFHVFREFTRPYRAETQEGKAEMRLILLAMAAFCWTATARAEGERAGDFDYYVLSLSWSAAWCALEGDARDDPQCDAGQGADLYPARPLAAVRGWLALLVPHDRA